MDQLYFELLKKMHHHDHSSVRLEALNLYSKYYWRFKCFLVIRSRLDSAFLRHVIGRLWLIYYYFRAPIYMNRKFIFVNSRDRDFIESERFSSHFEAGFFTSAGRNYTKIFHLFLRVPSTPDVDLLSFLRQIETYAYWLALQEVRNSPKCSILLSSYSPATCALYFFSKKKQLKTVFINIGLAPKGEFTEVVSVQIGYAPKNRSVAHPETFFLGSSWDENYDFNGVECKSIESIGLFLPKIYNFKTICELVVFWKGKNILIRNHPFWASHLKAHEIRLLRELNPRIQFSSNSLIRDCGEIDVAISGWSSVIIDCLRSGLPTLFCDQIDLLKETDFDFGNDELVPNYEPSRVSETFLNQFFGSPSWIKKFDLYRNQEVTIDEIRKIKSRLEL